LITEDVLDVSGIPTHAAVLESYVSRVMEVREEAWFDANTRVRRVAFAAPQVEQDAP
jgi:hypothetical protein